MLKLTHLPKLAPLIVDLSCHSAVYGRGHPRVLLADVEKLVGTILANYLDARASRGYSKNGNKEEHFLEAAYVTYNQFSQGAELLLSIQATPGLRHSYIGIAGAGPVEKEQSPNNLPIPVPWRYFVPLLPSLARSGHPSGVRVSDSATVWTAQRSHTKLS